MEHNSSQVFVKPKYKATCSNQRKIQGYPSFELIKSIDKYTKRTKNSESSLISLALENYFRDNPEI